MVIPRVLSVQRGANALEVSVTTSAFLSHWAQTLVAIVYVLPAVTCSAAPGRMLL